MKRISFLILAGLFTFSSCDKPSDPYKDNGANIGDQGGTIFYGPDFFDTYPSSVLLEDFTGFKCQNCGPAIQAANDLGDQWGDRLVVVGYHVLEFFAAPDANPQPPDFIFSKDFRTEEGEELASNYNVLALPQGLVNRTDFGSGPLQFAGQWAGRVSEQMDLAPRGFVDVIADSISVEGDQIKVGVAVRPLSPVDEDWNLVVGIFENDIIEGQKDGSDIIFPFVHKHVFRGYINGLAGQSVITPSSEFAEGEADYYSFTKQVNSEWVLQNCYAFAFLQNTATLEILAVSSTAIP